MDNSSLPPDDILDLYVPGRLRCPKCAFQLTRATLFAQTGEVGMTKAEVFIESEPCPNDGTPMVRVLWREEADDNRKFGESLIDELLQATGMDSLPAAMEFIKAKRREPEEVPAGTTLKESWERFSAEEQHAQVEIRAARRAFYAGAQTFCTIMAASLDDELDEEEAAAMIDASYKELADAVEEMKI